MTKKQKTAVTHRNCCLLPNNQFAFIERNMHEYYTTKNEKKTVHCHDARCLNPLFKEMQEGLSFVAIIPQKMRKDSISVILRCLFCRVKKLR